MGNERSGSNLGNGISKRFHCHVTLFNTGKSTDFIQSMTVDCYGDKAFSRRHIRRIMTKIESGGDAKDGRTGFTPWIRTDSNIKLIKDLMDADGRLTLDEMAQEINLNRATIHRILSPRPKTTWLAFLMMVRLQGPDGPGQSAPSAQRTSPRSSPSG